MLIKCTEGKIVINSDKIKGMHYYMSNNSSLSYYQTFLQMVTKTALFIVLKSSGYIS